MGPCLRSSAKRQILAEEFTPIPQSALDSKTGTTAVSQEIQGFFFYTT
jgi:hypothetical protein